ncbi:glutaminyl-peptide cyclotransferase [Pleurocapsa sp. CCALA 161]|uniref:glutaminyl-peptide cyclotransferase n=1 Tax=Pleurocapsa sp. CCALA 161 TaxID=2107688 RepID=UPI0011B26EE3|nr:glutaminyl-peptide cyclotransferase [Pleurocapsa sp. CCALA 161]
MRLLYWLLQLHSSKLYGMMHNAIADAFCKIGDRTESDRLLVTGKLWPKLFEIKPICD